ncbi:MAG: hypothetical protein B7Y45_11065 [Sphingomonas sp. 28-66-16]|nr:MAG: hypothetical protein B7Y45_11065 [Sphingomonas sp. 28-66-16]
MTHLPTIRLTGTGPLALATTLALSLAGCAAHSQGPANAMPVDSTNWKRLATKADRDRLRSWRDSWMKALARARIGDAAKIEEQGALFDPDRALSGAVPPSGAYRCRVFKLGAVGTAMAEFTRYPDFHCRIGDGGSTSSFVKLDGAQRPSGLIFHDSPSRAIFLGTLILGDETRQMRYGRDAGRDMIGYVERVGENRWRLVLPAPQFESMLDVIELVPES